MAKRLRRASPKTGERLSLKKIGKAQPRLVTSTRRAGHSTRRACGACLEAHEVSHDWRLDLCPQRARKPCDEPIRFHCLHDLFSNPAGVRGGYPAVLGIA